jgi:hypothetical protein
MSQAASSRLDVVVAVDAVHLLAFDTSGTAVLRRLRLGTLLDLSSLDAGFRLCVNAAHCAEGTVQQSKSSCFLWTD